MIFQIQYKVRRDRQYMDNNLLMFQVLDMDIENGVGCGRDYLQIGAQERLCGRRIPGEIRKCIFTVNNLHNFISVSSISSSRTLL